MVTWEVHHNLARASEFRKRLIVCVQFWDDQIIAVSSLKKWPKALFYLVMSFGITIRAVEITCSSNYVVKHVFFRYLPKVFDTYSGAEGFLFLQDDTILNYWNLLQADKSKLWITDKVPFELDSAELLCFSLWFFSLHLVVN